MDVSQAIDVLISKSDTASLTNATRVIRESPITPTIRKLLSIGFSQTESMERREATLVLLRGKLLEWEPKTTEDQALGAQIEVELCKLLNEPTDPLLTWRAASVISAILSKKISADNAQDDLVQSIARSFEAVGSKESCSEEELFSTLNLLRAICIDGLPSNFAKTESLPSFIKSVLEKGFKTQSATIVKLVLDTAGSILEAYRTSDAPAPEECGDILGGVLQLVEAALNQVLNSEAREGGLEHLYLEYGLKAIMAGGSCDETNSIWNAYAINKLQSLRDLCDVPKIAGAQSFHSDIKVLFIEHICDLVAAACTHIINTGDRRFDNFVSGSFLYLMRCISLTPSTALIQETMQTWELSSDLQAAATYKDIGAEYDDLCMATSLLSQDAFDKLVMFAKDHTMLKELTFNYCDTKLSSGDPVETYGAWVALACFLGSVPQNGKLELPGTVLSQFISFAVQSLTKPTAATDPIGKFAAARARWAAVHLVNETVKFHGESLGDTGEFLGQQATRLGEFYMSEACVKVKVTMLMAIVQIFCQLAESNMDALKAVAEVFWKDFLEPEVAKPSPLAACTPLGTDWGRGRLEAEAEVRELLFSAMSCLVVALTPAQLASHYNRLMPLCLRLLSATPMDQQGLKLAQCVLDLATRFIETIALLEVDNAVPDGLVTQGTDDAVKLMKIILLYNDLFATADKSALPAIGSFESCLLQGAARIVSFTEECQVNWPAEPHLGHVINELAVKKLRTLTAWEITDRPMTLSASGAPSAGLCEIESFNENQTKFTVTQSDGTQKTMTINTSSIEQQVACLSFIGVSASKIFQIGRAEELREILSVLQTVLVQTLFPQVRKAGISALGDLLGIMGSALTRSAVNPVTQGRPVAEDGTFRETLQAYASLWVDITNIFLSVVMNQKGTLRVTKIRELSDLFYVMADMGDGFRDSGRVAVPSGGLTDAQNVAVLSTVRKLFEASSKILIECNKADADVGLDELEADVRGADAAELRQEALDILCDAVMQLTYRLMVGLGPTTIQPFEEFLKPLYGILLALPDAGPISRTAAIVLMSHYYGLGGCPGEVNAFLQSMIVLTRSSMDQNLILQLQGKLPGIEKLRDLHGQTDLEVLRPIASLVLPNSSTGGDSIDELLDDWKGDFQGEVMRIQAACFGVGVGVEMCHPDAFFQHVPAIADAFLALINHPLVALPCRRVILDCLGCATLRIIRRFGDKLLNGDGLFSLSGLGNLLDTIFPLLEDSEDAQMAHDILIQWVLEGASSNEAVRTLLPKISAVLAQLEELSDDDLVSFTSLHSGRFKQARTTAEALLK